MALLTQFFAISQKRRDFCDTCHCDERKQAIDCRGRDLEILPTINSTETTWSPKTLDLRDNPRLTFLGALSNLPHLEALYVPCETRFIIEHNESWPQTLQKIESDHMDVLRSPYTKARVRIWTMAEFIEAPMEPLQGILDEIGRTKLRRLSEVPRMVDLTGFGQFLQNLKNQGMHPYLMGDFPVEMGVEEPKKPPRKPYLVR